MIPSLTIAFWAAALVTAYTWFGYPVTLAIRARLRPAPPVRRAPMTPRVSILVAAHNEELRIAAKIRNCFALDYPPGQLEVVVASDGSTDRTAEEVEALSGAAVRVLRLPGPKGKPSALNAAAEVARGEVLLLCDARQDLEPQALRELVANLADPTVGAVSGELHLQPGASAAAEGVGLYWRLEKVVRRLESTVGWGVGVTGAIYVVRKELFPILDPRTILDDVAVPVHVARTGHRVVFEPRAKAWDQAIAGASQEFRRKVRTLAGNYQLVALDPSLVDPRRNPVFFAFVSHKLLRLAVPWCLIAALGASLVLGGAGSSFFMAAAAVQVGFYGLAAAGWLVGLAGAHPRILSAPYAIVLLNLAAAAALVQFARGRSRAAWRASA